MTEAAAPNPRISNTMGIVNHRSLRIMPSRVCAMIRGSVVVAVCLPEEASDDVPQEENDREDMQSLHRQIHRRNLPSEGARAACLTPRVQLQASEIVWLR